MQSQTGLNYAEVHSVLRSAKNHRQLPKKQNRYLHYLCWLRFFCEAGFFFRGLETRSGCEKWCGFGVRTVLKDKDITLCTKAPEEHQDRRKGFYGFG